MSPLEKMARAYEESVPVTIGTGAQRDLTLPTVRSVCCSAMMAALKTLTSDELKAAMTMVRS